MTKKKDKLLEVSEVALRLRVGETTVRRLLREGAFDVQRVTPNTTRILESSLDRYLAYKTEYASWVDGLIEKPGRPGEPPRPPRPGEPD